ncbi:MAG: hypothetical protein AAFQ87_20985 [Bacteroidota bacterium]
MQGRLSEKWFYTHIKHRSDKLPRIDLLNMLSHYAGFDSWESFQRETSVLRSSESKTKRPTTTSNLLTNKVLIVAGVALLAILTAFIWPRNKQSLCVVDADGGALLSPGELSLSVWIESRQQLIPLDADSSACIEIAGRYRKHQLIVKAPYYHADTLDMLAEDGTEIERLSLRKDDYALMIHYFSTAKLTDWQKRRSQLDEIFADNARILQEMPNGNLGMEMYNKWEFIDKLTTPINSLRNLRVKETLYVNGKIVKLRFQQE